jgi:ABC-type Fe3+/spermidine/putrescine transport system ATPase subunit
VREVPERDHSSGHGQVLLELKGIRKSFGGFLAIDNLDLEIKRGEIFALLGPSGCGKSTTLRQIAGFDRPDHGEIKLGGRKLVSVAERIFVPPQNRNMGMVFQSHAVWPHLSVFENVAYPLRLRRVPREEIERAVQAVIGQVGLEGLESRPSTTLSGGQRQRVALARALVYRPEVLLLDEPFSSLDVKLREQMGLELKVLHRQVGITTILVTHDQSEALGLADRIMVMNRGRMEQVGIGAELYDTPATPFVRDFIGQINKIPVTVTKIDDDGEAELSVSGGKAVLSTGRRMTNDNAASCVACIRPENIRIGEAIDAGANNVVDAGVEALLFAGDRYECVLDLHGTKLLAVVPRGQRLVEGSSVRIQLPREAVTLWSS